MSFRIFIVICLLGFGLCREKKDFDTPDYVNKGKSCIHIIQAMMVDFEPKMMKYLDMNKDVNKDKAISNSKYKIFEDCIEKITDKAVVEILADPKKINWKKYFEFVRFTINELKFMESQKLGQDLINFYKLIQNNYIDQDHTTWGKGQARRDKDL